MVDDVDKSRVARRRSFSRFSGLRCSSGGRSTIRTRAATPRFRARCSRRRLGDSAPRRLQLSGEAAAAVLGNGAAVCGFGQASGARASTPGLTGYLSLLLVYAIARRLWGAAAGLKAVLLAAGSILFMLLGHQLTLDMALSFWLLACLACFLFAQSERANAPRLPRLDARLLGVDGARGADQGVDRRADPRLHAGRLRAVAARLARLCAAEFSRWGSAVRAARGAVVRACREGQSRVPAVLFHPRALPAILDADRGTQPSLVVFHSGDDRRHPAMDDAWRCARSRAVGAPRPPMGNSMRAACCGSGRPSCSCSSRCPIPS
jgi:hypothetical protein